MTIRRRGGLADTSLRGALLAEMNGGRRPTRIAVGSEELRVRATRILSGGDVTEAMQTIVPHVELDVESLAPDEWELRQEGE